MTHAGYGRINVFRLDDSVLVSLACTMDSFDTTKRVPIWTASAPSMKAAAMPRPSPIPPAAITGYRNRINYLRNECHRRRLADVSAGLRAFSDDGVSSAFLHQPCQSNRSDNRDYLNAGVPSTCSMYLPGIPAPVVTTFTPSSTTTFATSSAYGAHQHDVYAERLLCQLSGLPDFIADYFSGSIRPAD